MSTFVSAVPRNTYRCVRVRLARKLRFGNETEVHMPLQRSISRIVTPGPAVAGCQKVGHSFIEVIPADDFINSDPFIRLTDDRMEIENKEIGAPHPHAGFEALVLLLEGAIRNRENGVLLSPGDLIWLTAGSGIIHNENVETAAPVHALQLWVTLPKADRWTAPAIQDLCLDGIPLRRTPGVEVRLYSGVSGEYHAATQNHVPVTLADIQMSGGSVFSQEAPTWYNGFVYVLSGAARFGVSSTLLHKGQIGWLDRPDDDRRALLSIAACENGVRFIFAAGQPQSDPIVTYGPFVADSQSEIYRLYREYRSDRFKRTREIHQCGAERELARPSACF